MSQKQRGKGSRQHSLSCALTTDASCVADGKGRVAASVPRPLLLTLAAPSAPPAPAGPAPSGTGAASAPAAAAPRASMQACACALMAKPQRVASTQAGAEVDAKMASMPLNLAATLRSGAASRLSTLPAAGRACGQGHACYECIFLHPLP